MPRAKTPKTLQISLWVVVILSVTALYVLRTDHVWIACAAAVVAVWALLVASTLRYIDWIGEGE